VSEIDSFDWWFGEFDEALATLEDLIVIDGMYRLEPPVPLYWTDG